MMLFDLRKMCLLDYYDFHHFPMNDFDLGSGPTENIACSIGRTENYQYDVVPIDFSLSSAEHDKNYKVFPSHKTCPVTIKVDCERVITGSMGGEVKMMNFNVFRKDLSMSSTCTVIKG